MRTAGKIGRKGSAVFERGIVVLRIPYLPVIHGKEADRGNTVANMIPGAVPVLLEKKVI